MIINEYGLFYKCIIVTDINAKDRDCYFQDEYKLVSLILYSYLSKTYLAAGTSPLIWSMIGSFRFYRF